MSQANDDERLRLEFDFFQLVSRSLDSLERVRQTPEGKKLIQAHSILAKRILAATMEAHTVEELLHCEMVLQRLDEHAAQDRQDSSSIENAQRDYRQLAETVAQMRRNPEEYFRANIAFRETGGDYRKLPRGRIQQIHANVTRLRNRASFASEDERWIWDDRVKLAEKTGEMVRALHNELVRQYKRDRE